MVEGAGCCHWAIAVRVQMGVMAVVDGGNDGWVDSGSVLEGAWLRTVSGQGQMWQVAEHTATHRHLSSSSLRGGGERGFFLCETTRARSGASGSESKSEPKSLTKNALHWGERFISSVSCQRESIS